MAFSADDTDRARIVAAVLRNGSRVLLCHRSASRRWSPDVWDLPGGHVEPGEMPGAALVRELREELGIEITAPSGPPLLEVGGATFAMQVWLVDAWSGTPINAAPDEHDTIGWFEEAELADLCLAHEDYLPTLTQLLAG